MAIGEGDALLYLQASKMTSDCTRECQYKAMNNFEFWFYFKRMHVSKLNHLVIPRKKNIKAVNKGRLGRFTIKVLITLPD